MAHAGGRPTKLTGESINDAAAYVEPFRREGVASATQYLQEFADAQAKDGKLWNPADNPTNHYPTIEGLALRLDVSRSTIYEWAAKNKKFAKVIVRLLNRQAHILQNLGLIKLYDSAMARVLLTKHGYIVETRNENNNFEEHKVQFVNDVPRPTDQSA